MSTKEPLLSEDATIIREMKELSDAMQHEEPGSAAKAEMQKRWLEWDARRMEHENDRIEHENNREKIRRASQVRPDTWISAGTTILLCAATLLFESRDIITSSAKRFWQQRFKADRED